MMVGSGIDSGEKAEWTKILLSIRERKRKGQKFCCRFWSSRFGSVPVWYETGHFLAKTPESYGKNSRMTIRAQKFSSWIDRYGEIQQFFVDTGDFRRRYGRSAHIVRVQYCAGFLASRRGRCGRVADDGWRTRIVSTHSRHQMRGSPLP